MEGLSMTSVNQTITPRNIKFKYDDTSQGRWWLGGDPVASAFYSALSAGFPVGERFNIECVRPYRDLVQGALKDELSAFIQQEFAHAREHATFNHLIAGYGYDLDIIEREAEENVRRARKRDPLFRLCISVAFEHLTASLGRVMLSDPRHLQAAPAEMRGLLEWHCLEELDHKSVAYDTYLAATSNRSAFRRWFLRCFVMFLLSAHYWPSHFRNMARFFRHDGINTPRTWLRTFVFLWIKPGLFRTALPSGMSYFRPGFHPGKHDDSAMLATADQRLVRWRA
jgi:predicted metal-dependent hydrolase